jgi:hypothetical protein
MAKHAISVTLDADNLVWLRGRAAQTGVRSVSELLDQLVTAARERREGPARSVVGTIDIVASDAALEGADAAVRHLFQASLLRPAIVRGRRTASRAAATKRRRGR